MRNQDTPLSAVPHFFGDAPDILIIRAPYYKSIIDGLTIGAQRILSNAGVFAEVMDVSGAYELPQAIRLVIGGKKTFNGFIVLGCIIRGETDHYEFICRATMEGILSVSLKHGLCVGTGLLTCNTLAQAEARSNVNGFNKGTEAAVAALTQINVSRRYGKS